MMVPFSALSGGVEFHNTPMLQFSTKRYGNQGVKPTVENHGGPVEELDAKTVRLGTYPPASS
jgi:hypothetical protein